MMPASLFVSVSYWKGPFPFVISTEAQRSGEISVWMLLLGKTSVARISRCPE
jgi:hypothetical protein